MSRTVYRMQARQYEGLGVADVVQPGCGNDEARSLADQLWRRILTRDEYDGETWSTNQHHEISLACDDVQQSVAGLIAKGAQFTRDIRDDGYGLTTALKVPGAGEMMLYQPKHPPAYNI